MNCPGLYGQRKKNSGRKYQGLVGEAPCRRRLSSLSRDARITVKMDMSVDALVRRVECGRFAAADTLRLEGGEEIFRHDIVIRVSCLDMEGVMPYCCVRLNALARYAETSGRCGDAAPQRPFYHLFILKTLVLRSFPLGFPFCHHRLDFRQQCLNMCAFPHNRAP